MHSSLQNLNSISNKVNKLINEKQLKTKPKIIVVTKQFSLDKMIPLIKHGQIHFGENQVQEADLKWSKTNLENQDIQLHMIGKLQANKAKRAVKLFDYIHSLDNAKLASKIFQYEKELNKKIKLFIQVNLGKEAQKSGITLSDLGNFYIYCTKELNLNIIGLMCLPPIESNSQEYFNLLKTTADKFNLQELSMGMSADYENAILNGSTYLRLGTAILGKRNN